MAAIRTLARQQSGVQSTMEAYVVTAAEWGNIACCRYKRTTSLSHRLMCAVDQSFKGEMERCVRWQALQQCAVWVGSDTSSLLRLALGSGGKSSLHIVLNFCVLAWFCKRSSSKSCFTLIAVVAQVLNHAVRDREHTCTALALEAGQPLSNHHCPERGSKMHCIGPLYTHVLQHSCPPQKLRSPQALKRLASDW